MKRIMIALLFVSAYGLCFLRHSWVYPIVGEERLLEQLTALLLLGTGIVAIRNARRDHDVLSHPLRSGCYLLAALMFLAAMEEISWGQTLLHFNTPEAIVTRNVQAETNLHNLDWWSGRDAKGNARSDVRALLNSNRAADAFAIVLVVGLPWIHRRLRRPPNWLQYVDRRIFDLAVLLALTLVLSLASESLIGQVRWRHRAISEVREASYAVLFLAWASRWRAAGSSTPQSLKSSRRKTRSATS